MKGGEKMQKRILEAKIKTYTGNSERQKHHADAFYASYKSTNSPDAYKQSQYYYKAAEKSAGIADAYRRMLANGEYEGK